MKDIGLKRGTVQLVPFKETWAEAFQVEKTALKSALGDNAVDIQHVGSTAIIGLTAKPIIDIAIAVPSLDIVEQLMTPLHKLGYDYTDEQGVPSRRFFAKGPESNRTHYLHISEANTEYKRLVFFRDSLNRNPELCQQYESLKRTLAAKFPSDRAAYTQGKNDFIKKILAPS